MTDDDKWDRRFLQMAAMISTWSKDPRARIGAVIVDENRRVVATGFNGFPANLEDDEGRLGGPDKNELFVHAEASAIHGASWPIAGSTVYVHGKPTCAECARALVQAGVRRVVAPAPGRDGSSKWDASGRRTLAVLLEAGVIYHSADAILARPAS